MPPNNFRTVQRQFQKFHNYNIIFESEERTYIAITSSKVSQ